MAHPGGNLEQDGWGTLVPPTLDQSSRYWAQFVLERCERPDLANALGLVEGTCTPARASRQARHVGLQRCRSTLVTGTLLLATKESSVIDFLLSSDFANWRPLCVDMQFKLPYIAERIGPVELNGCLRLFEQCFEFLMKSFEPLVAGSSADILRVNSALAGMYVGPILYGEAFRNVWQCAVAAMKRCGLFEHLYLRMQLAVMGAYAGDCEEHRRWLLEPENRNMEIADILLFVRKDVCVEIGAIQIELLRGRRVSLIDCLYPPRPMTTLKMLLDYVCSCMRSTEHLTNPTLALMVLTWLTAAPKLTNQLLATRDYSEEHVGFLERLKKVNRVQVMEKRRFWTMVDELEEGLLRSQLKHLWQSSAV